MTDNMTAVATKIDWSSLSGVILDGGYELKEVLDGRDNAAKLRVRILGSGGKTGLAYFLHLEPVDAIDQLDIWNTLREASHPNVSRPAAVGSREIGGFQTVYLVLSDADETLAAVVPERPLEWEEAAEVLHSCEKGLAHLHAHGLAHGNLSPRTVEAVGYSVQLNTESVRRIGKGPRVDWNKAQYLAPESKNLNLTAAADVWCLGATLFEVLSQEPYGTAGAELEKGLPLAAVIQRCLDKNPLTRCTLKEAPGIEQQGGAPLPQPAPPPPDPSPEAKAPSSPPNPVDNRIPGPTTATTRSAAPNRMPLPLTPKPAPKQVTKEDMALVPIGKRHRKVQRQPVGARIRTLDAPEQVFVMGEASTTDPAGSNPVVPARILALGNKSTLVRNAVAVVGLVLLFAAAVWFIIIPKLQSTEQPLTSSVAVQISPESRLDSSSNLPVPSIPAPAPANAAASGPAPSASTNPPPDDNSAPIVPVKREFFRVVLASFATRAEAGRDMDTISAQHPELILQISHSRTDKTADPKYLLGVGGMLQRSDAEPLLQRVQKKGLTSAHLERIER